MKKINKEVLQICELIMCYAHQFGKATEEIAEMLYYTIVKEKGAEDD